MTRALPVVLLCMSCSGGANDSEDDPLDANWTGSTLPCDAADVAGALVGSRLEVGASPSEESCGPGGWTFGWSLEDRLDTCFFEVDQDQILTGFDETPAPDLDGAARAFIGTPSATVVRAVFQFYPTDMLIHGVIEYDLDGFTEPYGGEIFPCEHFALGERLTPLDVH